MKIKSLDWDSNFFNKKIGGIFIAEDHTAIGDCAHYDVLYVKTFKYLNLKVDGFSNNYSETKVIFSKEALQPKDPVDTYIESFFETNKKKEDLYQLAFESGKYSRLKLDSNFTEYEFRKLYRQWVDNSFNLTYADAILVYIMNEKIIGFVTYKLYEKYGKIGLIAVNSESQGKRVGSNLINAVEIELVNQGISELRIPTQLQNKQACDFYTKLGYHIIERIMINHYWKL